MSAGADVAWARQVAAAVGITRIADVTGLDYVGLPVFQAIRPRSRNYIVSQGKGLSAAQAEISAIMESVELFHAELVPARCRASIEQMGELLSYDPATLARSPHVVYSGHVVLDWVPARNLWTGATEHVPADVVCMDFTARPALRLSPFRKSTNGLASGRTREQATLHGVYEVVERHCISVSAPALVSLSGLPAPLDSLVERVRSAGLEVQAAHLPGGCGLPCFKVSVVEAGTALRSSGYGCHATREVALGKALTEALQSRLTVITGSRDDLREQVMSHFRGDTGRPARRPMPEALLAFTDVPTTSHSSAAEELADVLTRVRVGLGAAPLAVDLTRADLDVPVVFVVAPGLSFTKVLH